MAAADDKRELLPKHVVHDGHRESPRGASSGQDLPRQVLPRSAPTGKVGLESLAPGDSACDLAASSAVPPPSVPSVLTVDELAALLRVNRKTVYEALARGEIPGARRVGNTYRILREAVIVWFTSANGRVSHSKRKK
jgi:excisionase family DNA binding protein